MNSKNIFQKSSKKHCVKGFFEIAEVRITRIKKCGFCELDERNVRTSRTQENKWCSGLQNQLKMTLKSGTIYTGQPFFVTTGPPHMGAHCQIL